MAVLSLISPAIVSQLRGFEKNKITFPIKHFKPFCFEFLSPQWNVPKQQYITCCFGGALAYCEAGRNVSLIAAAFRAASPPASLAGHKQAEALGWTGSDSLPPKQTPLVQPVGIETGKMFWSGAESLV